MNEITSLLEQALSLSSSQQLSDDEVMALARTSDTAALMQTASVIRDRGHHNTVSYSRKVFIPLTHLCRDVCHYCTFAQVPRKLKAPYMTPDEVLKIAQDGAKLVARKHCLPLGISRNCVTKQPGMA